MSKRRKKQRQQARVCGSEGCTRITLRDVCDNCRAARQTSTTIARLLRRS